MYKKNYIHIMSPCVVPFVLFSSFISIWIWCSVDFIHIWSLFSWHQNSSSCGPPASMFFVLFMRFNFVLFIDPSPLDPIFIYKTKVNMWLSLRIMVWIEATGELRKGCHNQHGCSAKGAIMKQLGNVWNMMQLILSLLNKIR